MKKTQKIKHKKQTNSVHLTKKARLIKRRHQIRRQKQVLCLILFLIILLSLSFLILRPLRTSRQTHMINSACESYRSDVEQVAAKYDMSAYVDLILALMMQESSGQGTDVMQSSEGAYNTQYPQTPNGITDVDYSIACGIQELKYSMTRAGVTGPNDIVNIKLALQGYNFGADVYFNYLEKNGITSWSEESSKAFSEIESGETERYKEDPLYDTAGPWDYGDQYYPEHVLRYYHS